MPVSAADPLHMFDMGFVDDATEGERPAPLRALLAVVLLATIVGGAIDLYLDAPEAWWSAHVIYEIALIAVATATSVILWSGWWRSRRRLVATRQMLATHAAERAAWRASAAAAFFLDDLFLPASRAEPGHTPPGVHSRTIG